MARKTFSESAWAEHESWEEPREPPGREEEYWDEPELPEQRARMELELLQGPWLSGPGRHEAKLLIAGGRFSVHFKNGAIYMGVFELDLEARPKAMAMRIDEGPAPHKGKISSCIYELTGDTLHWCATRPGSKERLDKFPPEYNPNYVCLTFRREEPREL